MLKGIPNIISPELLKVLMEMGHGDEIVIADANFPSASIAQNLVRLDGLCIPLVLESVLRLFPLDSYVGKPVALMAVTAGDPHRPAIWEEYRKILLESHEPFTDFEYVERFAFYKRARTAHAIVATGESALYANVILRKGVVVYREAREVKQDQL